MLQVQRWCHGTRTLERVGRIERVRRGGIFLRRDGTRTLERVGRVGRGGIFLRRVGTGTLERVGRIGRVGIFLLIKHRAWYFPGRAAGIQLTAGR
jgi:hypothetical protein